MSSATRLSRWVMYFGLFAGLGTFLRGQLLSATLGGLLAIQYPAYQFYRGYRSNQSDDQSATE